VASIAERFGGGGHENASGCTLDGPLPTATELILDFLRAEIAAAVGAILSPGR
jgi:bifunctional oligoribonuclease and PAP phosphatase NrnA